MGDNTGWQNDGNLIDHVYVLFSESHITLARLPFCILWPKTKLPPVYHTISKPNLTISA